MFSAKKASRKDSHTKHSDILSRQFRPPDLLVRVLPEFDCAFAKGLNVTAKDLKAKSQNAGMLIP